MLIILEPKTLNDVINHIGYIFFHNNSMIFNFNSNSDVYTKLDLMPDPTKISYSSPTFDSDYISMILNNEYYFTQFMKIVVLLKNGLDVFFLIYNEDSIFNPVLEVLLKLIQQRYGYNYNIADSWQEVYDLVFTTPWEKVPMFTTPGIMTYDIDFVRYQNILAKANPSMFINERIDDSSY